MNKFINSKGFNGSKVPRFTSSGIHPNSIDKGKMGNPTIDAKLGPGRYDLSFYSCFDEKKLNKNCVSDWRRALFLEQQGKIPHFMSKYLYKEKEEQKRKMGPGKYEFTSFTDDLKDRNYVTSMQSITPRFPEVKKDSFPGPGNYGIKGIPGEEYFLASEKRKHCNTVGLLKRGGKSDRNFFKDLKNIGPGIYKVKASIDDVLLHRTGLRNLYDINSEEKLQPLKYGHRAILPPHDLGPGHYPHKEFIQDLNNRSRKFKGKFLSEVQYPARPHQRVFYIDPTNTPPDPKNQVCTFTYDPRNPNHRKCVSFGGKKYPFNIGSARMDRIAMLNFTGYKNQYAGPGRYNVENVKPKRHINSAVASFKSLSVQTAPEDAIKIIRERNRGMNLQSHGENKIDHFATEKNVCVQNIESYVSPLKIH